MSNLPPSLQRVLAARKPSVAPAPPLGDVTTIYRDGRIEKNGKWLKPIK